MQLFYAPNITLPLYTLSEEESYHAVRVLRLAAGDPLHLTDGRGTVYMARVATPDQKACVVEVTLTMPNYQPRGYKLTVALAPTKSPDRFEWFLEKATEVGVDRITPMICEHSERREIKAERSQKIITEAAKQSLKAWHPVLDATTSFDEVIIRPFDGLKLIAHCAQDAPRQWVGDLLATEAPVLVLIGPEGDFSPQEVKRAVEQGFLQVTFGPQRLRTETAGLAAVMAVHYFSHSWASKKK